MKLNEFIKQSYALLIQFEQWYLRQVVTQPNFPVEADPDVFRDRLKDFFEIQRCDGVCHNMGCDQSRAFENIDPYEKISVEQFIKETKLGESSFADWYENHLAIFEGVHFSRLFFLKCVQLWRDSLEE